MGTLALIITRPLLLALLAATVGSAVEVSETPAHAPSAQRPAIATSPSDDPTSGPTASAAPVTTDPWVRGPWKPFAGALGVEGDDHSSQPAISADGRDVVFHSTSANLVRGDTNRLPDIFVNDRATGRTTRISVSSRGAQAKGSSLGPSISGDGRYVAFSSVAPNLVPGDTNRCYPSEGEGKPCTDMFVHDRATGRTIRASVSSGGAQANDKSEGGMISADGRWLAFASEASNLVPGDRNGERDIFVRDLRRNATTRVSVSTTGVQGNGYSDGPAISADGAIIVFTSDASNLVAGDTNGVEDVFVHDRIAGTTERVSISRSATQGDARSVSPAVSGDGNVVTFASDASNLVPNDTNDAMDVFAHLRRTGRTTRISVTSGGEPPPGPSWEDGAAHWMRATLSHDGMRIAFDSSLALERGDDNVCHTDQGEELPCSDIYLHELRTTRTTRISLSSTGAQGDRSSWGPAAMTSDGMTVTFSSASNNFAPGPHRGCLEWRNCPDILVRDLRSGTTTMVSRASPGTRVISSVVEDGSSMSVGIADDGRYVAFASSGSNLVRGDTNESWDIFLRDRSQQVTERLSVSSAGAQANGHTLDASLSSDGRMVAFVSEASNLVAGDTNGAPDVFVRDLRSRRTTRVSVSSAGAQASGPSEAPVISSDGRVVAFVSEAADLVSGDTNGAADVFVHEIASGTTERVSISSDGTEGTEGGSDPSISTDGSKIAFTSSSPNLVTADTNRVVDVFVRDRGTSTTARVSVDDLGRQGDDISRDPAISGDGGLVAFASTAENLGANTEFSARLFLRDLGAGTTLVIPSADEPRVPMFTADGARLVFQADYDRAFIWERATNETDYLARCGPTSRPVISADGGYAAFTSICQLAGADDNGTDDAYVKDLRDGSLSRASVARY